MKQEIYEDVLKEEPKELSGKEYDKWEKRLHKSIGWTMPIEQATFFINNKEKPSSSIMNRKTVYDVELGDGAGFTCNRQIDSKLLSLLVQMNERLKRIEEKLNEQR